MQWHKVLPPPTVGQRWSGVVLARSSLADEGMCLLVDHDMEARFLGCALAGGHSTVYQAVVASLAPLTLTCDLATKVIHHRPCQENSWLRIKEICAGLGGLGMGCQSVGAVICASVDTSSLSCIQLQACFHGQVIHGSICDDDIVCQLHQAGGCEPAVLTAGFPCQPFSPQGDGRGFSDSRTDAYWGVLRTALLMRPVALILECVPRAGQDHTIQASLHALADKLQWRKCDVVLALQDIWPAVRTRWWCLLLPCECPDPDLRSWTPASAPPVLRQLIHDWPLWDDQDEGELTLSPEELRLFFDEAYGRDVRILDMCKPCPVVLHSYANLLRDCPCGCRKQLRAARLLQDGVRGFCIRSPRTGQYRFLHPRELALILTVSPGVFFAHACRDTLSLLGQIAAPAQSAWVFAHLCRSFEMAYHGASFTDPGECLQALCRSLRQVQHDTWVLPSSITPAPINVVDSDGCSLGCVRGGLTTVEQFLQAETLFSQWGQKQRLLDGGRVVPEHAILQCSGYHGPYMLIREAKCRCRDQPFGLLALALEADGQLFVSLVEAGTFVFQVLQEHALTHIDTVVDDFGNRLRHDARIWRSTRLVPLAKQVGYGRGGFGLCSSFVWDAAMFLLGRFALLSPDRVDHAHLGMFHVRCEGFGIQSLQGESFCHRPRAHGTYYWLVLDDDHWFLMVCHLSGSQFLDPLATIYIYNGVDHGRIPPGAQRLLTLIEMVWFWEIEAVYHAGVIQQQLPDSCGTVMLGHLAHALGLCRDPLLGHVEGLHAGLAFLSFEYDDPSLVGYGPGLQPDERLLHELQLLLVDKGVPADRAEERASLAIKKIGAPSITTALAQNNAWASLKALASRPNINMMLVKSDELQAKIRLRANSKFKIQPSEQKKKGDRRSAPATPLVIDPAQLQLVADTFATDEGSVEQISFGELGPDRAGLAFCHVNDVLPFLTEAKPISTKGLAVLTVQTVPPEMRGPLPVSDLRFPVLCAATQEPMLLLGSLVNLGQKMIARAGVHNPPSVAALNTQTLKLTVYRDQWPGSWDTFLEKPFREVMRQFPGLQLCREEGCGGSCQYYHPPVDETLDTLILDLWNRSWHGPEGKYVKPHEATSWAIMARVPAFARLTIQQLSGSHGLYCEPRTPGGREVDPAFAIVWLGNLSFSQVQHKAKTTPKVVAIFRLHQKYGLRFADSDFEEAFRLLKPDEPLVQSRTTTVYKMFPLPLGTQRHSLQKALAQWGWKARVMQPVAGSIDGTTWEVGSSNPPPSNIMQSAQGDVVVTVLRRVNKDPAPASLLASSSTKDHFRHQSKRQVGTPEPAAKVDPWTASADPWQRYKQMEDRLRADMRHTARQEMGTAMHVDSDEPTSMPTRQDARIEQLEIDMQELKSSNEKFHTWFQDAADANKQLHQHVETMHGVVEKQQQDLEQLKTDVTKHTTATQEQMNTLRSEVRDEFSSGFSRLEAMLEKRVRTS